MARFPTGLGQSRSPSTELQTFNVNPGIDAFGADIARGLADLSETTRVLAERQRQQNDFEAERRFQVWQGEQQRAQIEARQNAQADWSSYADNRRVELEKAKQEFFGSISPELVERYSPKVEAFTQDLLTDDVSAEVRGRALYQNDALEQALGGLQSSVYTNPANAEIAAANWVELVRRSSLPPPVKQQLIETGFQSLTESQYLGIASGAALGLYTGSGETDGSDVVAALPPAGRAFLNTIAGVESNGNYTALVFGGNFDDFSDHPRVHKSRADGRTTSAAGRYQFTATTWDEVAAQLGLTDFSPASQDTGAWHLAKQRYRAATGQDLEAVILSGDRTAIKAARKVLEPTWEGLQNMSDDEFANRLMGVRGVGGPVAGSGGIASAPDIWNDPRFASIPFDRKLQLAATASRLAEDRLAEQKKAAKEEYDARLNQFLIDTRAGRVQMGEQQAAFDIWITDFDDQNKVRNAFKAYEDEGDGIVGFQRGLVDPQHIWSYSSSESRKQWDGYYERFLREGVRNLDQSVITDAIVPLLDRTKMFAPELMNDLRGLAQENNPAAVAFAYTAMSQIEDRANAAWRAQASPQEISDLTWYRTVGSFYEPEELFAQLRGRADTKEAARREMFGGEAKKFFNGANADYIAPADVLDAFSGWFSFDPDLPESTAITTQFYSQFQALFTNEYMRYGDKNLATTAAVKLMQQRWQVSSVGGRSRLQQLAPEAIYERWGVDGGSHDWIERQARQELGQVDPRFFNDDFQFTLIADEVTERELLDRRTALRQGEGTNQFPSYLVAFLDEDGRLTPLQTEPGVYARWGGQITSEMVFENQVAGARAHTEQLLNEVATQLLELQEGLSFSEDEEGDRARIKELNRRRKGLEQTLEQYSVERQVPGAETVVTP